MLRQRDLCALSLPNRDVDDSYVEPPVVLMHRSAESGGSSIVLGWLGSATDNQ